MGHTFQVIHAPEHPMRIGDGLLGLLARAGAGDAVLIEQLDEPLYWGSSDSNVIADPNPRLEAYLAAARRGARVRVLLDSFFDDLASPRSNLRAVEYLNAMKRAEGWTWRPAAPTRPAPAFTTRWSWPRLVGRAG
jgi:hypothetical protein